MITVRVYGTPAPQGSKARGRHGGVYEMSKKVGPWRAAVSTATERACEQEWAAKGGFDWEPGEPVDVAIVFLMPRPAMHYRKNGELKPGAPARPATRPDIDKLARSTLDGLKAGGAYADDGQVAGLWASKFYADDVGEDPGATIEIRPCKETAR